MLKINDKKIYSEDVQGMLETYKKLIKDVSNENIVDICEQFITTIDSLINVAHSRDKMSEDKPFMYITFSLACAMLAEDSDKYADSLPSKEEIDKIMDIINSIESMLKKEED